jgi:hypothetical protein
VLGHGKYNISYQRNPSQSVAGGILEQTGGGVAKNLGGYYSWSQYEKVPPLDRAAREAALSEIAIRVV